MTDKIQHVAVPNKIDDQDLQITVDGAEFDAKRAIDQGDTFSSGDVVCL